MANKQSVLTFAGAGASKAVSPESYPTTVEFFESLPKNITDNRMFREVVDFLKQGNENKSIDIEDLLWRLDELTTFCKQINDPRGLPGWMLLKNRLSQAASGSPMNTKQVIEVSRAASSKLKQLVSDINTRVYDFYSKLPERKQLENNWDPLLKEISKLNAKVDIFTTNYDMILEVVLDKYEIVDNGWRGSIIRRLDTQLWNMDKFSQPRGLLTKLHGSVNWRKDTEGVIISDPMFKGSHEDHVIIYPGFKGRPVDPLFLSFHNYFASALSEARVVIFIGFAFRDEFINDLCERQLSDNAKVGIINPEKLEGLPFSNIEPIQWEKGFDAESTKQALEFIKQNIDPKCL